LSARDAQKTHWQGTIQEVDGLVIVKNPKEPMYSQDVFDSNGKYIVRISLKYRPQAWKNNRLYTIEEDEEGYQVVKRYKALGKSDSSIYKM